MSELVYKETVDQLMSKLDGEFNPYISAVARVIGCDPDKLRADPNFWRLTTGKRKRRILVTKLAEYLLNKN